MECLNEEEFFDKHRDTLVDLFTEKYPELFRCSDDYDDIEQDSLFQAFTEAIYEDYLECIEREEPFNIYETTVVIL